jgi:hypothetical protein
MSVIAHPFIYMLSIVCYTKIGDTKHDCELMVSNFFDRRPIILPHNSFIRQALEYENQLSGKMSLNIETFADDWGYVPINSNRKSSLITISSNRCDVALVQNEQSEE